jgi:Spy/CpxP family protein refolding chaperone
MNRALQWKLIAGFVLVFVAGGITGGFMGAAHARHFFQRGAHRGFIKERMAERLKRELNLTPDQVEKISPMLDKTSTQIESIRTETAQRVHETMAQAHREIATVLTDEQREKLKQMHRQRRGMRAIHSPSPSPEDGEQ